MSAHWVLKILAIGMLYVFFGHPSIYAQMWERQLWLAVAAATCTVPIVTWECIRILIVRLCFDEGGFALRTPLRAISGRFADIRGVERRRGEVSVTFRDGNTVRIPWLVGNLDYIFQFVQQRLRP